MLTLAVLGPLIVTGALFCWRAQMVRGPPTALTCFFVGFRTDFVTSVRLSVAPAGVLARGGPKPQEEAHTLIAPPPLATSLINFSNWFAYVMQSFSSNSIGNGSKPLTRAWAGSKSNTIDGGGGRITPLPRQTPIPMSAARRARRPLTRACPGGGAFNAPSRIFAITQKRTALSQQRYPSETFLDMADFVTSLH